MSKEEIQLTLKSILDELEFFKEECGKELNVFENEFKGNKEC